MTTVSEGDRELLELAAKAAGVPIMWIQDNGAIATGSGNWNPLTDDGDAFRLAVRLGLFWSPVFSHFLSLERFAHQDRDDCYAHRRAVVRAAAMSPHGDGVNYTRAEGGEDGASRLRFDVLQEIAQTFGLDYNAVCRCANAYLAGVEASAQPQENRDA